MKYIKGYEGNYSATEDGKIFSHRRNKYLKPHLRGGYYCVELSVSSIKKRIYIHRLVAETFIDNPMGKETVNHIDGNPLNNELSNLEWMTMQENNQAAWDKGQRVLTNKMKEATKANFMKGRKHLSQEIVNKIIDMSGTDMSNRAIANSLGVAHSTVGKIINNSFS